MAHGSVATIVFLFTLSGLNAGAQGISGHRVGLDSMLSEAGRANLGLQANRRQDDYWKTLSSRVVSLPRTQVGLEYGNINSMKTDTRFFISQTLQMPVVYRRDKALYEASGAVNRAAGALKKRDLERDVRMIYIEMQGLLERDTLLARLDSIYRKFGEAAKLRLRTGETGKLEEVTADAQVRQLAVQREQLHADMSILQERLAALLNRRDKWLPDGTGLDMPLSGAASDAVRNGPLAAWWQAQSNLIARETDRERSGLLPEFTIGYSNLSLVGWQSPDGVKQQYFGPSQRFGIYGLSMGLPLFNGATRARIRAGELAGEVNRLESEQSLRLTEGRLSELTAQLQKDTRLIAYHRQTGLAQAETIIQTAARSLSAGEISYIDWTVLMNQAIQIRSSYLDALQSMRKTVTDIIHLTGKP